MKHGKTATLLSTTLLVGLVPLAAFNSQHSYYEIISGVSVLAFLFSAQELNRAVLEESVTKKGKAYRDFVETLGLFAVIAAGLTAGIVPFNLSLAVLVSLGVVKIYELELSKRFRQSFNFRLGEKVWIGLTAAMYLLASSNLYFLFYGYLLLAAVMLYDLLGLFQELRERNRV